MLSIAYVSASTGEMSEDDVAAILKQSRANNVWHQLTGALLYHRGRFIQVIEGPDDAVRTRLAIIAADPRHSGIRTISEKQIGARQFPEWTMGFVPLSGSAVTQLEGFDDFFGARTGLARLEHAENEAQQLLEWLREYWFAA
ncbi:hypothetical protein BH09ACT5_BH09ACT5_11750 [soil metagenome]